MSTATGSQLALSPGSMIAGKYLVESVLGKGGMGVVVAARHVELDERVAIKFLLADRAGASTPVATERFLREARAAAKVKSEHVCRVFDIARLESGEPYIVMELLEGADLGEKLASEGRQPAWLVAKWIIEACSALAEAHAAGIVHRDLKPANLFLAKRSDGSSLIKLLDFGVSKMSSAADMTQTSMMLGSPLYMSPEQVASSRNVDARTDIWSLGVILYELLAGRPPFAADSVIQLAYRVREEAPQPLGEAAETPSGLARVVHRCLEKDPANRYDDVRDLAAELATFAPPESAFLAERLARGRAGSADLALSATAREMPSARDVAAASSGVVVRTSDEGQATVAVGQATFAPLQTTQETQAEAAAGQRRPTRHLVAGIAIGGVVTTIAVVLVVASTRTHAPASEVEPASASAPAPAAPDRDAGLASAAPPVTATAASASAALPSATSETAGRPSTTSTSRRAPSAPSAPSATAQAPDASAGPSTATADPAPSTRKTRAIDRNDPF